MEDNKIVIEENGVLVEYNIVFNVEDVNGKNYVVYTKGEKENDDIVSYAAEYEIVNGKTKFKSIKDDKTWEFINELLSSLQNVGEKE